MVHETLQAADELAEEGIVAEVIDVATLKPIDFDTILESVAKTGRCVIVTEAPRHCSLASEIAAASRRAGLLTLLAPVERVTAPDVVVPLSRLEQHYMPGKAQIMPRVSERKVARVRSDVNRCVLNLSWQFDTTMKIFNLPDLGEGLQEAEIVKWHVKAGDDGRRRPADGLGRDRQGDRRHSGAVRGQGREAVRQRARRRHVGAPLVGFEGGDADTGTVVGKVEVGQKVMPKRPPPRRRSRTASRRRRRCARWRAG